MNAYPRLVRPAPTPAGLYFRPNRNDHKALERFLAGDPPVSGLVLDPLLAERHADLQHEARHRHIETVIDPRTVEMAAREGFTRRLRELPWAGEEQHRPEELSGRRGLELVEKFAFYVVQNSYSAALAPTHYVKTLEDPWLRVDLELARFFRRFLDSLGGDNIPVYYPLVIQASILRQPSNWNRVIELLSTVPVDAIWLRIHPFGTNDSGPLKLQSYIKACWSLQRLNVPLVASYTGTVGLPLLAFGAVGGIESGITLGERFDMTRWTKSRKPGRGFLPGPRVYIPELGVFLTRKQATQFFQNRQMMAKFGCRGHKCCRRGTADMIADPKHHFLVRRQAEVSRLSRVPLVLRPQHYLEDFLRPATDLAIRAVKVDTTLESKRRRLEAWRVALGALQTQGLPEVVPITPKGTRIEMKRGA